MAAAAGMAAAAAAETAAAADDRPSPRQLAYGPPGPPPARRAPVGAPRRAHAAALGTQAMTGARQWAGRLPVSTPTRPARSSAFSAAARSRRLVGSPGAGPPCAWRGAPPGGVLWPLPQRLRVSAPGRRAPALTSRRAGPEPESFSAGGETKQAQEAFNGEGGRKKGSEEMEKGLMPDPAQCLCRPSRVLFARPSIRRTGGGPSLPASPLKRASPRALPLAALCASSARIAAALCSGGAYACMAASRLEPCLPGGHLDSFIAGVLTQNLGANWQGRCK